MSSSTSAPAGHEKYYVPESSSLAVRATIGLVLSVFGAALMLNDMTFGGSGAIQRFGMGADHRAGVFYLHPYQLVSHCD